MQIQVRASGYRFVLLFLLIGSGLLMNVSAYGQQKVNTDSIRKARQHIIDSTRAFQQRKLDSTRTARKHITDSINAARRHVTDSLAAIRKYRESSHYKDSVADSRRQRLDSMKAARKAVFDSLQAVRKHLADSLITARKRTTDSVKAIQKQRSDSLAVIRKYKESKRYKDSVALVRQVRMDSIRLARKEISEKLVAERKKSLDSAAAIRKKYSDSVTAVRTKYNDSIKAVRKARAETLAKEKESRERLKKSQEKQKEDKMKLALELKIKKKRQAWSNEKMLKKKWSVPRRVFQNTYTHYNYYFNADRKMDEALANMQRMNKENLDSMLALFPFDPDRDSSRLAPDMDSIIQKASVGIQIHDPRTKWADDLYLLLGQAYYYKGNYGEASSSFRYIIAMNQRRKMEEQKKAAAKKKPVDKEVSIVEADKSNALDFLKHRSVNNEAILWLARTYTEGHKESEAESILDLIEGDKNVSDELKGRVALEKAYLSLGRNDLKAASENLAIVAADHAMPDWIRTRAAFLNGQILFDRGNYAAAGEHYQQVIDLKPGIEMDFYARRNLSYSLIEQGGSQEEATTSLRRMLKDGKYIPYHEQIYYVLGRLSVNSNRPDEAIVYLKKSIESPKSTRKQKALSFASLGDVYYAKGEYRPAKTAYDSASFYGRSLANDERIIIASKRGKVLDRLVQPLETITAQDSLLALAALPEKEQQTVVRRYIRELQKQKEDSAFRAANSGDNTKVVEDADPVSSGNWYFSSTVLMQQGLNDFKRKWGSRQNVDNWRRVGGIAYTGSGPGGNEPEMEDALETDEYGLPTETALLAMIPNTSEEQNEARQQIQKGYIAMATAYIEDLEDYPKGIQGLDTLDKRFSDHDHKAEVLYLRYRAALKQDRLNDAQLLSERLRNEYSSSQWAKELAPREDTHGLIASAVPVANYYDETYGLMMQRQYSTVLERVREGQKQYKDPVYSNRFRIMEAIALAGSGNFEQADTLLTQFISTHPSDSLRGWAETVMNYVKKNKPIAPPKPIGQDSASSGKVVDSVGAGTVVSSVSVPAAPGSDINAVAPAPAAYTYKPNAEHCFIFLFNKMESRAMGVKVALKDFNTFNYSSQNLSPNLEMLRPDQGIIYVRSFPSAAHARIYMNSVRTNNLLLKEYKPEEYTLMIISSDNLRKLQADKDVQPYTKFYKANYK